MGRKRKKFASASRSVNERWMTPPAWTIVVVSLLVSACNPVISGASLLHSISENNTVSTVVSVIQTFTVPTQEKMPAKKSRSAIMEDLRKAL